MGVPAFFRWLSRKYPSIIVNCVEEKPKECNGVKIPVDASKPNPNDVEFDNLYLDMNGIIHPCTHPEDKPAPKNEDEMMVAIFEYIDRLFNIVRPRRLLYMAIDGVAPRAKMNQQRSRRFRASKEGMEAAVEKQRVREEILAKADLIMLGLATHEPNFTIIREEFKPNKPKPCALCNQFGHEVKDCEGLPREKKGKHDELADSLPCAEGEFIFIRLNVLREYLERELTMASLPFPFDVERSIDDWVFMCFFVGNDFLPHLPSLEIREGAIDRLVNIYKNVVHKTGGYLTESGYVNLQRVQMIMLAVGEVEDSIFKKRKDDESPSISPNTSFASDGSPSPGIKRKAEDSDSEPEPEDNVRLWEAGWKQRYYKNKFDVDAADEKFRRKVVQSYVEGLCWVLRYYYQGCASWKWYYPFHYAPFASDFEGIADMSSEFEKGTKPDSSIIDFYPEDFAIDLNGKKYAWQGVALLPFVDERRLRAALEEVYPDLTPEENRRNSLGGDVMFVGKLHPLHDFILELYQTGSTEPIDVPPELCHGIQGKFSLDEEAILPDQTVCSPVPMLRDLTQNTAVSINFKDPQFAEDYVFKAVMLPGARKPAAVLKPGDWEKSSNGRQWKPQLGFNRDRRPVHLDQAAFRTLGHVMPRGSGTGVYSNTAPPPATYQGSLYRPLLRGQTQIPKLMSNMRPQDSWRGPPPLFQQQRFDRSVGAEPLLPWNRMLQTQNAAFQPNQYQMLAGPGGYPPRRDDRGGRQGYPREGRKYPLPPPSGRYSWN
ncbi:5'-3' exoribonuclease 2 [Cricetulus griseus]